MCSAGICPVVEPTKIDVPCARAVTIMVVKGGRTPPVSETMPMIRAPVAATTAARLGRPLARPIRGTAVSPSAARSPAIGAPGRRVEGGCIALHGSARLTSLACVTLLLSH